MKYSYCLRANLTSLCDGRTKSCLYSSYHQTMGKAHRKNCSQARVRHRTLNPLPSLIHKSHDFYRTTKSYKTREEASSRTSRKDPDSTDSVWEKWSWSVYLLPMDAIWQSIRKGFQRSTLKMSGNDEWPCRIPTSQSRERRKYVRYSFLAQVSAYFI